MFYAYIPLSSYMGTDMGQMPAAAALRLLRLRLEIPAADRGTVCTDFFFSEFTCTPFFFTLIFVFGEIRVAFNGYRYASP